MRLLPRPARLVIGLPLDAIVEPGDLPHPVLAHIVILVEAGLPELGRQALRRVGPQFVAAAGKQGAEAAFGGPAVIGDGDDVLHLEMIQEEAVHRAGPAAGEEILEPGLVEPGGAGLAAIDA